MTKMDRTVRTITRVLSSERLVRAGVWGVILASVAFLAAALVTIGLVARTEPAGKPGRTRIEPLPDSLS